MDAEGARAILGLLDDPSTEEEIYEAYKRKALQDFNISFDDLEEITRARDILLADLNDYS